MDWREKEFLNWITEGIMRFRDEKVEQKDFYDVVDEEYAREVGK